VSPTFDLHRQTVSLWQDRLANLVMAADESLLSQCRDQGSLALPERVRPIFRPSHYRAAKKKDDAETQKVYRLMLDHCNACHQQFADGEHQLIP